MNYYIVYGTVTYTKGYKSWTSLRTEIVKSEFSNTAEQYFKNTIIDELEEDGAEDISFQFVVHKDYRELAFIQDFIKEQTGEQQ
jgi:ferritin